MLEKFKFFLKIQFLLEKNSNLPKNKIEEVSNIINQIIFSNIDNKIVLKESINEYNVSNNVFNKTNFGEYYIDIENIINNIFENISLEKKNKIISLINKKLQEYIENINNEKINVTEEMKKWIKYFGSTKEAARWRKYFKNFEEAKKWNEYFDDVMEAYKWYKKGLTPEKANQISFKYNPDDID